MCIEIHVGQENGNEYEYFIQMTTSTIQANAIRQGMRHLKINANQSFRITIEDDIEIIEAGAFKVTQDNQTFRNLISVNICGNTMRVIGKKAFFGCRNIISIRISDNVTEIGEGAFSGCERLKCLSPNPDINNPVIKIPNGITSVSENLFKDSGVTAVMLPNDLVSIERGAFSGCEQLSLLAPQSLFSDIARAGRSVAIIPNNVKTIGSKAFEKCKRIEEIELPDKLSKIRWMTCYNCISLRIVSSRSIMPVGIAEKAFEGCSDEIQFPPTFYNAWDESFPHRFYNEGGFQNEQAIVDVFQPGYMDEDHEIVNLFRNWMETIVYDWKGKSENETVLTFNDLSRWLKYAINYSEQSCEDCIASILEWGHVNQHKEEHIPIFLNGLNLIENNKIYDLKTVLDVGKKDGGDIISLWSKILAAYKPGFYFIYDSRVATALSYVSLKKKLPCFWSIPKGRGDSLGNGHFVGLPPQIYNNIEADGPARTIINANRNHYSIFPIENQERGGASVLTSYRLYLDLLNRLAENPSIRDAYHIFSGNHPDVAAAYRDIGFSEKQAIMARMEKVLFMLKEDQNVFRRN